MTDRVLVFGGGGWVGTALLPLLEAEWTVVAPSSAEADVTAEQAVRRLVERTEPVAVVNLAACNPGQGDTDRMDAVNHLGAMHVAGACAAAGVRLVHVSSDVVLDGEHAPYDESAPPAPVNDYGRTKAAGETGVLDFCEAAVAVRTSLVFDPRVIDRTTRTFRARLAAGEQARLFTDEFRMPIARTTLAAALVELVQVPVRGILNVAGTEPLSRHAFGTRLLEWFEVPGRDRIEATPSAPLGLARPRDLTLVLDRARDVLLTPLRSVEEELSLAGPPKELG